MNRHVAFLRGINLGGRRVTKDRLREPFEGAGLANVATYLASGNVIFDCETASAGALEADLEARILDTLGFEADTFIRSLDALAAVDPANLFSGLAAADDPKSRVHVMFLRETPGDEVERSLRGLEVEGDHFRVHGREVYWLRRGGLKESAVSMSDLDRALGGAAYTMRTMNTIRRIVAKFSD